jgi:hypothetical protein
VPFCPVATIKNMMGKLLFEIPVYRTSFDNYVAEMKAEKAAYMQRAASGYDETYASFNSDPKLRDDHLKRMEAWFDRYDWYSWYYNDVVGWIRLEGHWDVIKADYHFAREKRIVRRPKRRSFEWCGKTLEVWLPHEATSAEIYKLVLSELQQLKRERPFRRRYIDLEAFQNVGPFIDWRNAVVKDKREDASSLTGGV